MLSFQLTMPRNNSWNNKWSGEEKKYFSIRRVTKAKETELSGKSFGYDFGDGWFAKVTVEKIFADEAKKRRRLSAGFCGYEWMIDEILSIGRIRTLTEFLNDKSKTSEYFDPDYPSHK